MSEFLHPDQVKLFVGDETGQTGRLGTVLSEHHQGILLFDEIEKAHHLIWDLFLQMIGDARITLADHKTYNLSGFYIVCTSNIGSEFLLRPSRLPFVRLESSVLGKLSRTFRPEFVGALHRQDRLQAALPRYSDRDCQARRCPAVGNLPAERLR
jgi:ATP-dependent Clp protease ATP-binding subunit ClpB